MKSSLRDSYRYCREVARREARNFYYGFLLLPPDQRLSMCALYAYMRRTDDLADGPGEAGTQLAALGRWRSEIAAGLEDGRGDWPGMPALADTVRHRQIPARYLSEVIDGVEMDLLHRRYETFEELRDYCYHVASTVGLCCLSIWGYRSDGGRAERLAEDCGVALQLTNILRDVREDAERGRVYLPGAEMERFGVQPSDLSAAEPTESVRRLLAFQAERARGFYERSWPLARLVDPAGRPMLRAIVRIYGGLLQAIIDRRFDVQSHRVRLPGWRKAAIALRSLVG